MNIEKEQKQALASISLLLYCLYQYRFWNGQIFQKSQYYQVFLNIYYFIVCHNTDSEMDKYFKSHNTIKFFIIFKHIKSQSRHDISKTQLTQTS